MGDEMAEGNPHSIQCFTPKYRPQNVLCETNPIPKTEHSRTGIRACPFSPLSTLPPLSRKTLKMPSGGAGIQIRPDRGAVWQESHRLYRLNTGNTHEQGIRRTPG